MVSYMNYMDAYTTYTMSFAVMITACIIFSSLFNAHIMIKVRKTVLFWGHTLVQAVFLIWLSGKLLELVSPTLGIMNLYRTIQQIDRLFLVPALLLFLSGMYKYGVERKLIVYFYSVLFVVFACIVYAFFILSGFLTDFVPLLGFFAFNAYVFYNSKRIFVELSDVSIDVFMERLEDAVVIFDRSGKLLDYNQNAKVIIQSIEHIGTIDDFIEMVNERIISGNKLSAASDTSQKPEEICMEGSSGIRHYMYGITISKNKKNVPIATVLTFHDVTEKTILLHELENKNAELDSLNIQLKNYIAVANQLEEESEKNRAVLEIQETIGHSITELLIGLEALRTAGPRHERTVKEKLSEIIDKCREIMSEIRISVEKLLPQNDERK